MAYEAILTDVGESLYSGFLDGDDPIDITEVVIGDGNGAEVTPDPTQTALVNEVYRAPVSAVYTDPNNSSRRIVELILPLEVGGFWVREAGIVDSSGNLVAICNAPPVRKPLPATGSSRLIIMRIGITVTRPDAFVEVIMDSTSVLATRNYVDSAIVVAVDGLASESYVTNAIAALDTDVIEEGANSLYFTGARVLGAGLDGLGALPSLSVVADDHSGVEANQWQSVAWSPELGLYCAVAASGTNRVMTSADGEAWTPQTAAEDNGWQSVTWSSQLGLFCAVANSGTNRVMTSPDGETWTAHAAAEANGWNGVVWAPGLSLFCAVASNGTNRVMTSPDGQAWTAQSAPAESWADVTWSPDLGLFCAVGFFGANRVMTSPDGLTWTARAAAESALWNSVTWSPALGLFCAVASSGTDRVMTSDDGETWVGQTAAEANEWNTVAWSPDLALFLAVADTGTNQIMLSFDGLNWEPASAPAGEWQGLAWSPQLNRFASTSVAGANHLMTIDITGTRTPVTSHDEVLSAFSKLKAQMNTLSVQMREVRTALGMS